MSPFPKRKPTDVNVIATDSNAQVCNKYHTRVTNLKTSVHTFRLEMKYAEIH